MSISTHTQQDKPPLNKKALRRFMRDQRNALTENQQINAANNLLNLLHTHPLFINSKRLAFYLANDGEIDPMPLLLEALAQGKHCYLPVLHPFNKRRLLFVRIRENTKLVQNCFGIWEPRIFCKDLIHPRALNLVLLPLVAFDPHGGRIGMGGGFYDYTFSFTKRASGWRPKLIGLAHECQKLARLELENWDIPLTGVATDQQLYLI